MISFIVTSILILIAALPLKNWLEIRQARQKDIEWSNWLLEKPSRETYCLDLQQKSDDISCSFCGSRRHIPRLESVFAYKPKFGFINIKFQKNSYFRTII
jgi:hypothetical protein